MRTMRTGDAIPDLLTASTEGTVSVLLGMR
jgi:hypothetical protein